ncbi:MAG: GAF domain-containing protein [Bacteroidales bacterium]|nr:GAF domain-containing protein [Bacteroidales bacterium]
MVESSKILSEHKTNLQDLSKHLLEYLVRYVECEQAALYVINEGNEGEPVLSLVGGYGCDVNKLKNKEVLIGENLVGSCFKDKQQIKADNLDPNYMIVSSGLGKKSATHLVLTPVMQDETIVGVLEVTAFKPIPEYRGGFLKDVGASLASYISISMANEKNDQTDKPIEPTN